jgi:hypothetical protein
LNSGRGASDKPAQDGQLPVAGKTGRRGGLIADAVLQFPNAQRGEQERFGSGKSACGSEFSFRVGVPSGSGGAGAGAAASLGLRFTGAPIVGRADRKIVITHN